MTYPTPRAASPRRSIVILCLFATLGSFTIDLYLPALPRIQDDLDASTAATQLTLTATTVGLALGKLVVGPWSDAVGRRWPLLWSTAIHVLASVGVALSPSIEWMLVFRLVQGLGAAGTAVVSMAVVRDLYAGSMFVRVLARVAIVTGLTPVVAPVLGVQLLQVMDWRGIFVVVGGYGVAMIAVAVLAMRETLPRERRLAMHPRALLSRYAGLARTRDFVGAALIGGMIVSGVFTMMTASSFLLQETYGLDSRGYAIVFASNAIAFVVGTQSAARIIRRISPFTLLRWSLPATAIAGFAIIPGSRWEAVGVTVGTVLFLCGAGMVGPCMAVIAMGRQGHQAGTAASVLGAANYGFAGLTAPLVGVLGVESAVPMALVMGGGIAVAVAAYWGLVDRARPASGSRIEDLVGAAHG